MQRAQLAEVLDQRLGAVDQLQQHEVGDLRGPPGTRGHHAAGQGFATLVQQAQQFAAKGRQRFARGHVQHGRDVSVIEHQRTVGTLFLDAYQADGRVVADAVLRRQQAQRPRPHGHRCTVFERGVVVAHFTHLAHVARRFQGFTLVHRVTGAGALERQGQVHQAVAQVVVDIQRARRQVVLGNIERRAIGQQAAGRHNRQLALGQQALVDQQFGEPPGTR